MPLKNFLAILSLFLTLQLATSCSGTAGNTNTAIANGDANENSNAARSVNDKPEELGMLITLPFEPTEAIWREYPNSENAAERKLKAVMRFEPADANKLAEESAKAKPPVNTELESDEWFPEELIAQSDMNEGSKLRGQEFAADAMLLPPFTRGRLVRIENTDYFILEAFKPNS
ncbi:MAG: hypothetical protein QUS14_16695 [Pyrinomonadaceae bacterium]|nr:hypothetical protein [Pyrinomonadaceae bacterium]